MAGVNATERGVFLALDNINTFTTDTVSQASTLATTIVPGIYLSIKSISVLDIFSLYVRAYRDPHMV